MTRGFVAGGTLARCLLLWAVAAWGVAHAQAPFATNDRWTGQYRCAQGVTPAILEVGRVVDNGATLSLEGVFKFGGGQRPQGAYLVTGRYDAASGRLVLVPDRWIMRPGNYVAVGLSAQLGNDGTALDGQMDYAPCGEVSLRKEGGRPATARANTEAPPAVAPAPVPATPPPPAARAPSQRAFAPLVGLAFNARFDYPGCTVNSIAAKERCVLQVPAVFTDRPWTPKPDGLYTLINIKLPPAGQAILGELIAYRGDNKVSLALASGRVTHIRKFVKEISLGGSELMTLLDDYFGPAEVLANERTKLLTSEENLQRLKTGAPVPKVKVTTYRWQAADSVIEFEYYGGGYELTATSR
ncbi:MAG: hypothetical protein QM639_20710 [Rhodocyclaceae bacterium]